MKTFLDCIYVGIGGAVGSVGRYLVGLLPLKPQNGFPLTTLLINIGGAFAIGIIVALAGKHQNADPRLFLFLKIGICGGFTTFSTFSFEAFHLIQSGKVFLSIAYMLLSVVLCVAAVACSQALIK